MKAVWKDTVLAQSNNTVVIEGNHYFPKDSLNMEFFKSSRTTSVCHWKGTAKYYTIEVNSDENQDAAWYYPTPSKLAESIKDHVAFWKGVEVVRD